MRGLILKMFLEIKDRWSLIRLICPQSWMSSIVMIVRCAVEMTEETLSLATRMCLSDETVWRLKSTKKGPTG